MPAQCSPACLVSAPACMTKPLSNDIRERPRCISELTAGCRGARWNRENAASGSRPRRRSNGWISSARTRVRRGAVTNRENAAPMHGIMVALGISGQLTNTVAQSTVWRPHNARPARHDLQKKPRTRPSNSELTSCTAGRPGSTPSPIWSPSGWCSLTRPALRPRWPGAMADPCAVSVAGRRCLMGTGRPPPLLARSALKA